MKLDLNNLIATWAVINPRTVGSDITSLDGTGVDRKGYESAVLVFHVGQVVGSPTSITVTCTVYESTDNSTFTAVSAIAAVLITATNTRKEVRVPLDGCARYITGHIGVGVTGGSNPYMLVSAVGILGASKTLPV